MVSLVEEEGPAFCGILGLGVLAYKDGGGVMERDLSHPFAFASPLRGPYLYAAPVCYSSLPAGHSSLPIGSSIDVTTILIYRNL